MIRSKRDPSRGPVLAVCGCVEEAKFCELQQSLSRSPAIIVGLGAP